MRGFRATPPVIPAKAGTHGRRLALPSRRAVSTGSGFRRNDGLFALVLAATLVATPAFGDSSLPPAPLADTQLPDPRQEAQARALMETLRCLVCQSQSIADSNAELAGDMRALVRRRIAAGETPETIRAWLLKRYGAWVSYDPPLGADTIALWTLPLLLLGGGLLLSRGLFKRRRG